ncbi:MAG: LysR family transcriptional regulator [Polyangiaceae bacterium]|nr:LysR family transcriptional regulator [Polyangiaceae bacterium]
MGQALSGLDVNLLVVLDALLAERSVERAARRVGLSSSAASHALARAREVLGDPLLVRAGRGMVLSPRAESMAPRLREGLAAISRAIERPRELDLAREERAVRLAAVDFAQSHAVLHLTATLRAQASKVSITVLPFTDGSLAALRAGELDLALAASGPLAGFESRAVCSERFVCLLRRGHPSRGRLTLARFAAAEHVLVSPRGRVAGAADKALRRRGLKRTVALVVPSFMAAALAVAQSDLVLTCAARSAKQAMAWLPVEAVDPPLKLAPITLTMLWHARTSGDAFLEHVRGVLAAAP